MLEMNVLDPGLATYTFGVDGKSSWVTNIPDCFVTDCGKDLASETYPLLAHCWLLTGSLTLAQIEGELWQHFDGFTEDERTIASWINTVLEFWKNWAVVMERHFLYTAPVKEYRDITGVSVIPGLVSCVVWTIDSTLLDSASMFSMNSQPESLIGATASKYF